MNASLNEPTNECLSRRLNEWNIQWTTVEMSPNNEFSNCLRNKRFCIFSTKVSIHWTPILIWSLNCLSIHFVIWISISSIESNDSFKSLLRLNWILLFEAKDFQKNIVVDGWPIVCIQMCVLSCHLLIATKHKPKFTTFRSFYKTIVKFIIILTHFNWKINIFIKVYKKL